MNFLVWWLILFGVNVVYVVIELQLVELQCDEIARSLSIEKAKLYVIEFPTSYHVESGFSRVSHLLTKNHSRLDIVKIDDLRLSMTIDNVGALSKNATFSFVN